MSRASVSIIVPAYNSESTIETYLRSATSQTYPNVEVIIVDDGSTDSTPEIVKKFKTVIYIRNPKNLGRQKSRNIGFQKSKGRYVWFMDSDMELPPNIVEVCVKMLEEKELDGLMIPERSKGKGIWAKCRGLEKIINDDDIYKNTVRFMKREVSEKVGGHDERFLADDMDFHIRAQRLGYRYELLKGHHIYHYEVNTIKQMVKKYFSYGKSMMSYARIYPTESFKQFSFIRPAYFKNYKLFFQHPFIGCGLLFLKSVQYIAASFGILHNIMFGKQKE